MDHFALRMLSTTSKGDRVPRHFDYPANMGMGFYHYEDDFLWHTGSELFNTAGDRFSLEALLPKRYLLPRSPLVIPFIPIAKRRSHQVIIISLHNTFTRAVGHLIRVILVPKLPLAGRCGVPFVVSSLGDHTYILPLLLVRESLRLSIIVFHHWLHPMPYDTIT